MTDDETDWVEETFGERVEQEDELALDDVRQWHEQNLEEYDDEAMAEVTTLSDWNEHVSMAPDGEVEMIVIGGDDDPFNNGQVFSGYALCIPEDDPVRLGAIRFETENVDLDEVREFFYEPFRAVTGEFDIRDAEKPVGSNAYRLDAVTSTTLEAADSDKTREERKEMVDDFVPEAKIASIGDSLSLTNENGFAAAMGVDMRRIPGAFIHETRVGDDSARLIVQDNSFVDARDLGKDVRGDEEEAGLVCWTDPDVLRREEGVLTESTIGDLYGSITPNQDGHVTMNLFGIDVTSGQYREEQEDTGSSGQEEAVSSGAGGADEERTI